MLGRSNAVGNPGALEIEALMCWQARCLVVSRHGSRIPSLAANALGAAPLERGAAPGLGVLKNQPKS